VNIAVTFQAQNFFLQNPYTSAQPNRVVIYYSITMKNNTNQPEIHGIAARTVGNVYAPTNGTVTKLRVKGDLLQAEVNFSTGKQMTWTRIQSINSVEIVETPSYPWVGLGVSVILVGVLISGSSEWFGGLVTLTGIAAIVYGWRKKRRLMVFYALNSTIPIFMNQPSGVYEKFAMGVLTLARQLNSSPGGQRQQVPQSRPLVTR